MKPIFSCRDVRKTFGALAAVDHFSLDVAPGEVLGIGGPNGAGKTTFFDIVSGLARADSGRILFCGNDISRAAPDDIFRAGLARTFQLDVAFDSLSVLENLIVSCHFGEGSAVRPWFGKGARVRAGQILELLDLAHHAAERPKDLPVYVRRLLMIGAALGSRPKMLLLDEPVGGLTLKEVESVGGVLNRVRQETGITIMLIEHVMRFLVSLSDRVVVMHQGAKLYEGDAVGMARDRTVIDVYLGEGAAERLASAGA